LRPLTALPAQGVRDRAADRHLIVGPAWHGGRAGLTMSFSLLEPWDHNRGSATLAKSVLLADAVTATLDSRDLGLLLDSVNTHAGRVGLLVPQT